MSQALIDFDISHEEFAKIIRRKNKYEGLKEDKKNLKGIDDVDDLKNTARNKENDRITSL